MQISTTSRLLELNNEHINKPKPKVVVPKRHKTVNYTVFDNHKRL